MLAAALDGRRATLFSLAIADAKMSLAMIMEIMQACGVKTVKPVRRPHLETEFAALGSIIPARLFLCW
jgi:hypothetical protein